jgi:hypothetical protein
MTDIAQTFGSVENRFDFRLLDLKNPILICHNRKLSVAAIA